MGYFEAYQKEQERQKKRREDGRISLGASSYFNGGLPGDLSQAGSVPTFDASKPFGDANSWANGKSTEYQNLQNESEVYGEREDGKDENFIEWISKTLDQPTSAVIGAVSGFGNMKPSDPNKDTDMGILNVLGGVAGGNLLQELASGTGPDIGTRLSQAASGFTSGITGTHHGWGDYESPISDDNSDNGFEKVLKRGSVFAADVASDPTTYLTFGTAGIGKKAVSTGVSKIASEMATKKLSDDAVSKFASLNRTELLRDGLGKAAKEADDVSTKSSFQSAATELKQDAVDLRKSAADQVGSEAAQAYATGNSRGLRKYLYEHPDLAEHADDIWKAMPQEARGGIRLTLPFSSVGTRGINEGGKLTDAVGLGKLGEGFNDIRNAARISKPVSAVMDRISGAGGPAWTQMIRSAHEGDITASRGSYNDYQNLMKIHATNSVNVHQLNADTNQSIIGITGTWEKAKDPVAAKATFDSYVQKPALVKGPEPTGLSEDQLAGWKAAKAWHQTFPDIHKKMTDEGITLAELQEFLPRELDKAYRENVVNARKAGTKFKGKGSSSPSFTKKRSGAFSQFDGFDDAGNPIFRWDTWDEANAASVKAGKGKVFNDDAMEVFVGYHRAANSLIARKRVINMAEKAGLIVSAGEKTVGKIDPIGLGKFINKLPDDLSNMSYESGKKARDAELDGMRKISEAGAIHDDIVRLEGDLAMSGARVTDNMFDDGLLRDQVPADVPIVEPADAAAKLEVINALKKQRDDLYDSAAEDLAVHKANLGDYKAYTKLNDDASKLFDTPERLTEFINTLSTDPAEAVEQAGDVLKTLADITGVLADRAPSKSSRAHWLQRQMEFTDPANKLAKEEKLTSEYQQYLIDQGFVNIANETKFQQSAAWSAEFANWYAPQAVADILGAYGRVSRLSGTAIGKFLDNFLTPFLGAFKTWATIGRGPGFIIRNIMGAVWNNFIIGVSAGNYVNAGKIMTAAGKMHREGFKRFKTEADPAVVSKFQDDYMREALSPELYDAWAAGERWGITGTTTRVENVSGVDNGTQASAFNQTSFNGRATRVAPWSKEKATKRNYFAATSPEDLNTGQKIFNTANDNWYLRTFGTGSQLTESYVRTASFLRGMDRFGLADGGDVANQFVKVSQFDYTDLSPFEHDVLRKIIPFYTWSRNNVPLQVRATLQNPKYVSMALKLQEAMGDVFGLEDENGETNVPWDDWMPRWMRDKQGFVTGLSSDGNPIALGMESPLNDLNKWLAPSLNPLDQAELWRTSTVSQLAPYIKSPVEIATRTDSATGAAWQDDPEAPNWARLVPGLVDEKSDGTETVHGGNLIANVLPDLLPPLGQVRSVVPFGQGPNAAGRQASSLGSYFGAPVGTLTPNQVAGELATRNDSLRSSNDRKAASFKVDRKFVSGLVKRGVDPMWLREQLEAGRSAEEIQDLVYDNKARWVE